MSKRFNRIQKDTIRDKFWLARHCDRPDLHRLMLWGYLEGLSDADPGLAGLVHNLRKIVAREW